MTKNQFQGKFKDTGRSPMKNHLIGILCLCLFSMIFFRTAAAASQEKAVNISLTAKNQEIMQDEAVPSPEIDVQVDGDGDRVLDHKTGSTINDLVAKIKKGEGYEVKEDVDAAKEGDYPIVIKLTETYQEKSLRDWLGKITIHTSNATLVVKNKYGQWDGDNKFKKWDGTQVVNDWVVSKGNTYYFGEDGNKVSGWQTIGTATYFFNKSGVMQTGWQENDGKKYLLADNGAATVGWYEKDENTKYYFDADGVMVTGKQQIGSKKCVFKDNGVLESCEDSLDPTKPMVAITFDDGPGKDTSRLLDAFEQNGAHATFFMLGKNVSSYADVVKRMKDIGCELGNHSKDHPQLTKLSAAGVQDQINFTNGKISEAAGSGATVMRPPYGAINDTVKANVGMPMILWSVDTLDWKTKNKDATVQSILSAKDGDVVLLHDIHAWSVDAAIEAIPQLIAKGFQLVTVSELAEAKGYTLENGVKYSQFYNK